MLNRYEEILIRLVAAQVSNDHVPEIAARSTSLYGAARILESHFQTRDEALQQEHFLKIRASDQYGDAPALLKPQAE